MRLTAKIDTLIKTHPIDSRSNPLPSGFDSFSLKAGNYLECNWIKEAPNNHSLFELNTPVKGRFNWYGFNDHFIEMAVNDAKKLPNSSFPVIRKDQVESIFGRAITAYQFEKLDICLKQFDIITVPRIRHFLAQVAHESGGLRWIVELADGSAYEGRRDLGNIFPGDGRRFKGVDPLQMTGRANYQAFANYINDPRVMEGWEYVSKNYLFLPSGFWWKNNKMNSLIDGGASVQQVSRRVNGGINGLQDRIKYYQKAKQII